MYLCECMYMFVCVHVCAICEYAGVNVLIVVFVCLREKNDEEKKKPHKRQQCKYEDEKEKKKKNVVTGVLFCTRMKTHNCFLLKR